MIRRPWSLLACVAAMAFSAAVAPSGAQPLRPTSGGAERKVVELAPRTPLYCEDSTGTVQPMIHGDYGDLAKAVTKTYGWGHVVMTNGPHRSGGEMLVALFSSEAKAGERPESLAWVMTRHEDGVALRALYADLKGMALDVERGNDLCGRALIMLVELHPERAVNPRHN
jgi:hypothetical protein